MFRKREPEPKSILSYSEASKDLINSLKLEHMLQVADSTPFLEHVRYREEHKSNLYLIVKGNNVWSLQKGKVWMAYHEEDQGGIYLEWVAFISKFRR